MLEHIFEYIDLKIERFPIKTNFLDIFHIAVPIQLKIIKYLNVIGTSNPAIYQLPSNPTKNTTNKHWTGFLDLIIKYTINPRLWLRNTLSLLQYCNDTELLE